MALGWVYVLTNPAMPGLIKIGQSSADPELRGEALYTTGVPEPFTVAYKGLFEAYASLERQAHAELSGERHRAEREFFRTKVETAVDAIRRLSGAAAKYEEWIGGSADAETLTEVTWVPSKPKGLTAGQIERERRRQMRNCFVKA